MVFVGIDLHIELFPGFDECGSHLKGVLVVHVVVGSTGDDEQCSG